MFSSVNAVRRQFVMLLSVLHCGTDRRTNAAIKITFHRRNGLICSLRVCRDESGVEIAFVTRYFVSTRESISFPNGDPTQSPRSTIKEMGIRFAGNTSDDIPGERCFVAACSIDYRDEQRPYARKTARRREVKREVKGGKVFRRLLSPNTFTCTLRQSMRSPSTPTMRFTRLSESIYLSVLLCSREPLTSTLVLPSGTIGLDRHQNVSSGFSHDC